MAQRKGFRRGSDRHAGTSSSSRSYGPPGSSSRASAPTHSPDRGSHTVGPTEHYQDRIQNIAAQNQRTRDLRNRASNQGFHQFLTPRDQVAKKTLGMRLSGLGGLFGALGRGALGFFGGLPGKALSGIMTAKNWAGNQGSNLWGGVKNIGEGVKEFGEYDNLMAYLNRNKVQAIQPIETIPTNQEIIGKRVGEDGGYFGMGSQYDQSVIPNNLTNNMGVNNQMIDPNFLALGAKDGGRIGYKWGELVDENIKGPGFDENLMASAVDPMDALNDMSMEIFNGRQLHELTPEEYQMLIDMANEQAMGEQDQGIASLV